MSQFQQAAVEGIMIFPGTLGREMNCENTVSRLRTQHSDPGWGSNSDLLSLDPGPASLDTLPFP